jgi:hypothetical protein
MQPLPLDEGFEAADVAARGMSAFSFLAALVLLGAVSRALAPAQEDWQAACAARVEAAAGGAGIDARIRRGGNPGGGDGIVIVGERGLAGVSGFQTGAVRDTEWYDLNAAAPTGTRVSLFTDRNARSAFLASDHPDPARRDQWVRALGPALDACLALR